MFRPLLPLIRRLHFYAGILIAPFLLVATVSGGLYALAPSAEAVVYRDLLTTQHDGPPRTIAAQVESARAAQHGEVTAVDPAAEPGQTTRVYFTDPSLGESERRTVFVDPASARVLGSSVTYGSNGALPMRAWISQLHRNLHLGEPGRVYSELAASWLWVVALGGLALWLNRFRTRRRNTGAPWWRVGVVERRGNQRARTLNWHGAVGVWLVVGVVFLSATGLTWSQYAGANIADLRSHLSWQRPSLPSAPSSHHHHDGPVVAVDDDRLDDLLTTARNHGLDGRVEIALPTEAGSPVTITQTRQPWRYTVDSIAVDPVSMHVTAQLPFSQWSWPAKLTDWAIQLHMGILFGWVSALALFSLMAALTTVIVRGYLMWWRRGPGTRPGRAPKRGTWRTAAVAADRRSRTAFALLIAATVLVGWFVPLLGISLLAFLVVDAAVGRFAATPPVAESSDPEVSATVGARTASSDP
ncbi:hypothetical protein GOARA_021_01030 [Gordonia araii NBRC 100433]|uniref:PepSY domain-containing protein n=1 Tax=Gordonia araii NBRC 100433 TaxID=1073574 RepID=G7GZ41_9ACTN|nr:PepSY-associated TM helix domain-containing protein [Gordonia araii]NNG97073.1 PepSY domain-containing protein [Gordonia araii NBRC 100433]GAB08866.1 hypothetical protein GOARA_021_01030 [Gordonia araii NBRC 100433]